jgi:hypothetical protein
MNSATFERSSQRMIRPTINPKTMRQFLRENAKRIFMTVSFLAIFFSHSQYGSFELPEPERQLPKDASLGVKQNRPEFFQAVLKILLS